MVVISLQLSLRKLEYPLDHGGDISSFQLLQTHRQRLAIIKYEHRCHKNNLN